MLEASETPESVRCASDPDAVSSRHLRLIHGHDGMAILIFAVVLAQGAAQLPVRDPAFAADGRLATSIEGDLWIRDASGRRWARLTSGPAWDREPVWTRDGAALVFVSDRGGGTHIWRIPTRGGSPEQLTRGLLRDAEPAVAADGSVIFVRGERSESRLWQLSPDGSVRRLTQGSDAERWPVTSPDGKRVAYVQVADGQRRLRVRPVTSTNGVSPAPAGRSGRRSGAGSSQTYDSVVVADRSPERPTWSPDGSRLVFFSTSPRPGIYVVPTSGTYVNVVSLHGGVPAWSPNGRSILLAQRPEDEPGYNGDPDRFGDRTASESFGIADSLVSVQAPVAPDESPAVVKVAATADRRARNTEAFDRAWERIDRVYFASGPADRRERWREIREEYRPRALAAADDRALEGILHEMMEARPPIRTAATGRAAVSSAHPVATAAGLEILRKGGNVVDAAVAVSFALGVVEPDASGPGGYGQMLISLAGMKEPALIEFMSRVPEEATLWNASLLVDGKYPPDGPLLAMVPGTVAGMHTAWKRFGSRKVPWADLLAPAIRAARDGYEVSQGLATTLRRERNAFAKYEGSRALFFRNGEPLSAGDTIHNPDLAWTLEQIAKSGADGFYRGPVAERLVADLRGKGSPVRLTDLSRYFAAERDPVSTTYRGTTIFSSAPPVSGGATLAAQLNLLEHFPQPKRYTNDAATLHAMITAWQLVPSGRGRTGDPSLWPTNTEPFTSKDTAQARWACYDPAHALRPGAANDVSACADSTNGSPGSGSRGDGAASGEQDCHGSLHAAGAVCRASGTTAFAVADADGNAVAVTQTLGTWGGNFYVTPGLGFIYNDKLTSYSTDPDSYGARIPYARHGSTLAPTLVFRGEGAARRPVLAVGAAGNQWITAAVYETLVGVIDFGLGPQEALELARFIPSRGRGGGPGPARLTVTIEDGFSPDVLERMRAMGYDFDRVSLRGELREGYGAAVVIGAGSVTAGADPRRAGAAGAIP